MRSYGWIFLEESLPEAKPITGFCFKDNQLSTLVRALEWYQKRALAYKHALTSTHLQARAYQLSLTSTRLQAHACKCALRTGFFLTTWYNHLVCSSRRFYIPKQVPYFRWRNLTLNLIYFSYKENFKYVIKTIIELW